MILLAEPSSRQEGQHQQQQYQQGQQLLQQLSQYLGFLHGRRFLMDGSHSILRGWDFAWNWKIFVLMDLKFNRFIARGGLIFQFKLSELSPAAEAAAAVTTRAASRRISDQMLTAQMDASNEVEYNTWCYYRVSSLVMILMLRFCCCCCCYCPSSSCCRCNFGEDREMKRRRWIGLINFQVCGRYGNIIIPLSSASHLSRSWRSWKRGKQAIGWKLESRRTHDATDACAAFLHRVRHLKISS